MSNYDPYFFSTLLAKEGRFVEPQDDGVEPRLIGLDLPVPRRHWKAKATAAVLIATTVVLGPATETNADTPNLSPTPKSSGVENEIAVAHDQMSGRIIKDLLYDKYRNNAEILAEAGEVERCEEWVAKMAEVSLGGVATFNCNL